MKMERQNTYYEENAISYLPHHLGEAVRRSGALYRGSISEIRLRQDSSLTLTSGDRCITTSVRCTTDDLNYTLRSLCGNSLYSHSETIKEGYVCTDGGLRAGVCGRAVTDNGMIISVTDISSISIRIPHRVPGASDGLCKLVLEEGFKGMLIYAPPGVGKTTALRELVARLAAKPYCLRVAVVDTRFEICGGLSGDMTMDALSGYPRAKGMETALRTLSPQLIVCDEIGSFEDSEAVRNSFGSGVATVVTTHGISVDEVKKKPYIRELCDMGVFSHIVGLERRGNDYLLSVYMNDRKVT